MGWVYFIRSGARGPIKIGTTIHAPHSRARGLQTGNPEELHVIAAVRGGPELEARLHGRFATSHLRGEWFNPTQELVAFIEGIRLSHEQPEDDGSTCPFTDEQLQWLQGWHAALHADAVSAAQNKLTESFGGDLNKLSLCVLGRVLDSCRALDAMADASPREGCDCDDRTCLSCAGWKYVDADTESAEATILEYRADECMRQHGLATSVDMWENAPVAQNALEWLHGALSVAFGIDRLHMAMRAPDAADRQQRGEDAVRALDSAIGVAFNEPWKVGVEFGRQFYRVDDYKSRFRARFSGAALPPPDSEEPESLDRERALNTIMLGIGGDGS